MNDSPMDQAAIDSLLKAAAGKAARPGRGGSRAGGGTDEPPQRHPSEDGGTPPPEGAEPQEPASAPHPGRAASAAPPPEEAEPQRPATAPHRGWAASTAPPPEEAEPQGPAGAPHPGRAAGDSSRQGYERISHVPVELAVVLGDLEMPISDILKLKPGSVVQLDAWIDTPVEIRMRGRTVARAQIVTLEDSYALRIVENLIATPDFPTA